MKNYKIAIVGATGLVGTTFLRIFEQYNLPVSESVLFASAKSAGSTVQFFDKPYTVRELTENSFDEGFDIAVFSAGGGISKVFAPIAAAKGCVVIDNSSQWRMDANVPLVVPEVNPEDIKKHKGIIANPNCSTIQAVLPLSVLHKAYKIKRIVFSTYQAVSGAGVKGKQDLESGIDAYVNDVDYELVKFPHPIFNNCLPHIDSFLENGYTKEEEKMVNETRKIMNEPNLRITATTVRVPVLNCHSEAVNVEFEKPFDVDEARALLAAAPGIIVEDDVANNVYPLATTASGKDEVFVGRIRRDFSLESGLNMFVVADNIRKGAATNTVQIAKYMIENGLI